MSDKKETIKPIDFWASVEQTDPSMTKSFTINRQNRTTVDAQYKKRMITSKFGMYGLGWGVDADSEKFTRINYENQTVILHYRALAYYFINGDRGEFPIAASIKESFVTNKGQGYLSIDDEAIKKVRTDALTKGFTDLGFCADIHMGMFDDDNYIIGTAAKFQLDKEVDSEVALEKSIADIKSWVTGQIESAKKVLPKENSFKAVMRTVREKLITRCNAAGISPKNYTNHLDKIVLDELEKLNQGKTDEKS